MSEKMIIHHSIIDHNFDQARVRVRQTIWGEIILTTLVLEGRMSVTCTLNGKEIATHHAAMLLGTQDLRFGGSF